MGDRMLFVLLTNASHMLLGWGFFNLADTEGSKFSAHTHTRAHTEFKQNICKSTRQVDISGLVQLKQTSSIIVYKPTLCLASKCTLQKSGHSFKMQPEEAKEDLPSTIQHFLEIEGNAAGHARQPTSISAPYFLSLSSVRITHHPLIPGTLSHYRSPHV